MPYMPRKDNLLDSTGYDWFRSRVLGCHMLYRGDVVRVEVLNDADNLKAIVLGTGKRVLIPKKDIKGFAELAYPQLGYRRLPNDAVVYLERQHNYMRGLRRKSVHYVPSPCTDLLQQRYPDRLMLEYGQRANDDLMVAVFKPGYDKPQAIDDLLEGTKLSIILNHDVLIEPSVVPQDDDYVVYFRRRVAGRLNSKKEFKWYTPGYRQAVAPLLGNYGVHK